MSIEQLRLERYRNERIRQARGLDEIREQRRIAGLTTAEALELAVERASAHRELMRRLRSVPAEQLWDGFDFDWGERAP